MIYNKNSEPSEMDEGIFWHHPIKKILKSIRKCLINILSFNYRSDSDKLITICTLWEGAMSVVNGIELWQESMLLSTDESEEVETPTENAFVVVLAETGLSVLGFSNLTRAGAE